MILILAGTLLACSGPQGPDPTVNAAKAPQGMPLKLDFKRPGEPDKGKPGPPLMALELECKRHMERFGKLPAPRPYFLSYQLSDIHEVTLVAAHGALQDSREDRRRVLDVDLRVGDYKVDNTNPAGSARFGRGSWLLPLGDDPAKLRPTIWLATEQQYRRAKESFSRVKTNMAVKARGEDTSDDFSREKQLRHLERPAVLKVDQEAWKRRLRMLSAAFKGHPWVLSSAVTLKVSTVNRYLVSSEGTVLQSGRTMARLMVVATTRTGDGMDLQRIESMDARSVPALEDEAGALRRIQQVIKDLDALRKAPLAEPYVGPAILDGLAAGVYFHEIFGHRMEGHRQKQHREGQTFAKKVGKQVLPPFMNVYDDPRLLSLDGLDLNGFYRVDDEGVPSRRASLVENGILKGFLMSRTPARGFARSNGHGRRQPGRSPVARQGNLIVHPSQVITARDLRQRLLAEIKSQGKPYGLRFALVEGGLTNTSRHSAQFFKVRPVMVYKVFPDGKEELVRGADIEGTPLTSLSQILAAGDDMTVFNGYCGAESGFVPVSAASPSLLVRRVEIARKMTRKEKLPILPPPPAQQKGGAK